MGVRNLIDWIRRLLSEADGTTPSSTRVLMYSFSFFSMWLDWRIFWHIFRLKDTTQLSIWLSNVPLLIGAEIGLIALPYTVNKGTNTLSDMANMFAQLKSNPTVVPSVNPANSNIVTNAAPKIEEVAQQLATKAVGSKGPKG